LALLPHELASKAIIAPLFLNDRCDKKESVQGITKSYSIVIICTKYFYPLANKNTAFTWRNESE
jgi:hypothetical protein